jgi:hypothetical protein
MPKGVRGSKKEKIIIPKGREIARDLVQDKAIRVCTDYDVRTILRNIEPFDNFNIIVSEKDLEHVLVPYYFERMDIAPVLNDPELNELANMYRRAHAVIIKNVQE